MAIHRMELHRHLTESIPGLRRHLLMEYILDLLHLLMEYTLDFRHLLMEYIPDFRHLLMEYTPDFRHLLMEYTPDLHHPHHRVIIIHLRRRDIGACLLHHRERDRGRQAKKSSRMKTMMF
jgi:hypothetical protein